MKNHSGTDRRRFNGIGLLIGSLIGALLAIVWFAVSLQSETGPGRSDVTGFSDVESIAPWAVDGFDPTLARPDYSPVDVVRLQLASIRDSEKNPERLVVCYSLASPDNRRVTGPLNRFAKLFDDERYRPLLGHRSAMIGRAQIRDGVAAVMTTVIAGDGNAYAFHFLLSRHSPFEIGIGAESAVPGTTDERSPDEESEQCWMTNAVIPALQVDIESA
ncbi:hypothetical protein Poly51_55510 [Rubripirellula tenax]|uniref:Uncharacterized protein n=1 Tax=Rubripirellula tenax TaxID=2528015 RepID=A0A5C6EF05_9BACT|nr:hypothetical protein [Rubripirellula tenax]TWU46156.1 hypothetical protein Poly51_55510 [Rubripirellula tenax]